MTIPSAPDVQTIPQMGAPSSLYGAPASTPARYESPYEGWEDWAWQTKGLGGVGQPSSAWNNAPGTAALAGRLASGYQKWLKGEQKAFDKTQAAQPQQAAYPTQQPVQPSYTQPINPFGAVPTGVVPASGTYTTPSAGGIPVGTPLPMGGMTPGISTGAGPVINPYSLTAQTAAGQAGAFAGGQGVANLGQAGDIRGGAAQVMDTAFDPQQELYDRTTQQLQDQVRANAASRGITMSPYGAGVENKAMSDFNIDWQNAQLGRQVTGLGAAAPASLQAGNLGQQGIGQVQAQGQMPWDTWNQQQQTDIQNWISYMNMQNALTGQQITNFPNVVGQWAQSTGQYTPVSALGSY